MTRTGDLLREYEIETSLDGSLWEHAEELVIEAAVEVTMEANGMKYYDKKTTKKIVPRIALAAIGAFIIYQSIIADKTRIGLLLCGVLLIAIALFTSRQIVSEDGVDEFSRYVGVPFHKMWPWEKIAYIYVEGKKIAPDIQMVFRRKQSVRRLVLDRDAMSPILEMALKKNPYIAIEYTDNLEEYLSEQVVSLLNRQKNSPSDWEDDFDDIYDEDYDGSHSDLRFKVHRPRSIQRKLKS